MRGEIVEMAEDTLKQIEEYMFKWFSVLKNSLTALNLT